jgi:hypothetical protein
MNLICVIYLASFQKIQRLLTHYDSEKDLRSLHFDSVG